VAQVAQVRQIVAVAVGVVVALKKLEQPQHSMPSCAVTLQSEKATKNAAGTFDLSLEWTVLPIDDATG
jgi:hypothetical protein